MRPSHLSLCFVLALGLNFQPGIAQADSEDPGASGVIDGSDVRQFLDSGARFNPTRMEEASRRFDKMIKMPPRLRRAKNWQEVIQRDENLKIKPTVNQAQGQAAAATGTTAATQKTGTGTTATTTSTGAVNASTKSPQEKHKLIKKVGRGLERAAEVVGFPISDEPLPGTVDASLAGDLPDGEDPRVYVHRKLSEKEKQAREALLNKAETRDASAEEVIPQGNNQPPAVIVK